MIFLFKLGEFLGSSIILSEFKIPKINSLPLKIGLPKKEVVSQPPFSRGYVTQGNSLTCFFDKSLWTIMMENKLEKHIYLIRFLAESPEGEIC